MSTEQVRPVIECFCQILSLYGFSTITSETFRLAKFDRSEAVKNHSTIISTFCETRTGSNVETIPLWRLIYEMMYFDSNKTGQKLPDIQFNRTPKDEIVDTIKRDLYKRGYTYEHFLTLDNQMRNGSRQLLVCVGWLIYHVKFIEKCMKQCLNAISNINEICTDENIKSDLIGQIKQALQSNSKLRSRLQSIEPNNQTMSTFERQLCQYPHLISQYLTELDHERHQLNLFLFWNKHENIFWQWMESVLDQPTIPSTSCEIVCQQLEAEKEKFNAAIDTLDSALIRLEQLWISNDDHGPIEHDVASIITSIDKRISDLFNQLLNTHSLLTIKSLSE